MVVEKHYEVSEEEGQSQITQSLVDLGEFRFYSEGQVKLLKVSSKGMALSDLHFLIVWLLSSV